LNKIRKKKKNSHARHGRWIRNVFNTISYCPLSLVNVVLSQKESIYERKIHNKSTIWHYKKDLGLNSTKPEAERSYAKHPHQLNVPKVAQINEQIKIDNCILVLYKF